MSDKAILNLVLAKPPVDFTHMSKPSQVQIGPELPNGAHLKLLIYKIKANFIAIVSFIIIIDVKESKEGGEHQFVVLLSYAFIDCFLYVP